MGLHTSAIMDYTPTEDSQHPFISNLINQPKHGYYVFGLYGNTSIANS